MGVSILQTCLEDGDGTRDAFVDILLEHLVCGETSDGEGEKESGVVEPDAVVPNGAYAFCYVEEIFARCVVVVEEEE